MILLIDLGNSRLKWGLMDGEGRLIRTSVLPRGELAAGGWLHPLAALHPHQVLIASVVSSEEVHRVVEQVTAALGVVPARVVTGRAAHGVRNGYGRPESLGVDRWLALVGARSKVTDAVCVIDAGTAITFDVMDPSGRHLGGLIAPGVALMRQALHRGTEGVKAGGGPSVAGGGFGTDTEACVREGALTAAAGFIDAALRMAESRLGCAPACLLTGGDGEALMPRLRSRSYSFEPHLVLLGLARYRL